MGGGGGRGNRNRRGRLSEFIKGDNLFISAFPGAPSGISRSSGNIVPETAFNIARILFC